jgi:hypothetical protein
MGFLYQWKLVVEKYTERHLTFESDRLVAIAGLARRFYSEAALPQDAYIAGLCKPQLLTNLLWRRTR